MTTSWPARRVGDRILCGRPTPRSGGCRGEIGYVVGQVVPVRAADGTWTFRVGSFAALPWGMTEDPPGSHDWRPTARAARNRARGEKAAAGARHRPPGDVRHIPPLPWRRRCPVCNVLAEVADDVLS